MERTAKETGEYVQRGYILKKEEVDKDGVYLYSAIGMSSIQPA